MKLPSALKNIAANHRNVTDNTLVAVGAANDRAFSGEEWEQITPWGNFPNEKGLQKTGPEQGAAMVAAFNSVLGKLKNGFRGVPIFVGHPDVNPQVYTDHRRYGKLEALQTREDGLYGKVAWNDLGEKNKTEGYFVYPSPVWRFKKLPGGVIEPFELLSVGMTNSPNITGVQPWAKNDAAAAASPAPVTTLKKWKARRDAGAVGAKNARAVQARAAMKVKATDGRKKVTDDDKAAAAAALDVKHLAAVARTKKTAKAAASKPAPPPPKASASPAAPAPKRATPPPPAPSRSSGAGIHVHIHGAAANSDPYFEQPFYGRARRAVRKNPTAEA